jgi:hypothetical protein
MKGQCLQRNECNLGQIIVTARLFPSDVQSFSRMSTWKSPFTDLGFILALMSLSACHSSTDSPKYIYLQQSQTQIRVDKRSGRTDRLTNNGWIPISFNSPSVDVPKDELKHVRYHQSQCYCAIVLHDRQRLELRVERCLGFSSCAKCKQVRPESERGPLCSQF